MPTSGFEKVANSNKINLFWFKDGRISLFNSPYFAHENCTAIDLYPPIKRNNYAPSPVRGKVIGVREIGHFYNKNFEHSDKDYVILLKSSGKPGAIIKILHVKPLIKIGDTVDVGDKLGIFVRSGFFDFWTDHHIHLEVRKEGDPLRARGGFKVSRFIKINKRKVKIPNSLEGFVTESKNEYCLLTLNDCSPNGLPVMVGDSLGIIDGGVPHYRFFGVHSDTALSIGEDVILCGKKIGCVVSTFGNMALAKFGGASFEVNGNKVGLSCYLHISSSFLKIVPQRPGTLKLDKLQKVQVNMV